MNWWTSKRWTNKCTWQKTINLQFIIQSQISTASKVKLIHPNSTEKHQMQPLESINKTLFNTCAIQFPIVATWMIARSISENLSSTMQIFPFLTTIKLIQNLTKITKIRYQLDSVSWWVNKSFPTLNSQQVQLQETNHNKSIIFSIMN